VILSNKAYSTYRAYYSRCVSSVGVVGLGYVGLTLAVALSDIGHDVFGVDSSDSLRRQIESGTSPFYDEGLSEALLKSIKAKRLTAHESLEQINVALDFVIIAIGSPIDKNLKTNIDSFVGVARQIGSVIQPDGVVILRSTVPVGTSRLLQEYFNSNGIQAQVAYCPERTIEGKAYKELFNLPQVVSANNEASLQRVDDLFSSLTKEVVRVKNCESAELVKLISNMWRDYTFAFSNQLFELSSDMDVNLLEVINAANYKYPRNAIPKPGAVGGPCLTKDTHIFSQAIGNQQHIFNSARIINQDFPIKVVNRLIPHLSEIKSLAILGWAFKGEPPTTDVRDTPTVSYFKALTTSMPNLRILGWDPEKIDISQLPPAVEWIDDLPLGLKDVDVVLLANNHPFFASDDFVHILNSLPTPLVIHDFWGARPKLLNKTILYHNIGTL